MKKAILILAVVITSCAPAINENPVLETVGGEEVSLDSLRGEYPTVINFWASWCSFCKDELPIFDQIHRDLPINVIGVNIEESPSTVSDYWSKGGYTFETYLDPNSALYNKFGVFTQPTTIFLDVNGEEVARKDGPINHKELMQTVDILINMPVNDVLEPESMNEPETADVTSTVSHQTSPPTPLLLSWYPDEVHHTIPLEQIFSGGPPRDGIPSVDAPMFLEKSEATFLSPESTGLLVEIGDERRFYPFAILNWHEIVNDKIGDKSIAITYCPLCASAVVYDRTIHTEISTFGVSGLLYESNLLMYDRASSSLWDQITGEAVVGPKVGSTLQRIPSDIIQFSNLPDGVKVLSTTTGYLRDYSKDPYAGYEKSNVLYFPVHFENPLLLPKTLVYGIRLGDKTKAYSIDSIQAEKRIQDTLGDARVLVQYDEENNRVRFTHIIDEIHSESIIPVHAYWFSWAAKFPETLLYTSEENTEI